MQKIEFNEQFLSHDEQFQLLEARGMNFSDEEKVRDLLKRIGYYRLSSYWHPFFENKQKKIFKKNTKNTNFPKDFWGNIEKIFSIF